MLFDARVDCRRVRLRPTGQMGRFAGADGSVWDLAGRAISGPAKGKRLRPVAADEQFRFADASYPCRGCERRPRRR